MLQRVSLASSAHAHAASQSHHTVAQVCLSAHLLCPSALMPVCMPAMYSTAMRQYVAAVHGPAMSQTTTCQLRHACVPSASQHRHQTAWGYPLAHLPFLITYMLWPWAGLVLRVPSPTIVTQQHGHTSLHLVQPHDNDGPPFTHLLYPNIGIWWHGHVCLYPCRAPASQCGNTNKHACLHPCCIPEPPYVAWVCPWIHLP